MLMKLIVTCYRMMFKITFVLKKRSHPLLESDPRPKVMDSIIPKQVLIFEPVLILFDAI